MRIRGVKKSFTLVELLVVIAIVSIVLAFSFLSIRNGQARARDSQRAANLSALKNSINEYYRTVGGYPAAPADCTASTNDAAHWIGKAERGKCVVDNFVIGLSPDFIAKLPTDPGPVSLDVGDGLNTRGLVYIHSTGGARECYKVIQYGPENPADSKYKSLWDPARDGVDGTSPTAWAIYSPGCAGK